MLAHLYSETVDAIRNEIRSGITFSWRHFLEAASKWQPLALLSHFTISN